MAPREPKVTPKKVKLTKTTTTTKKTILTNTSVMKKAISTKKTTEQTPCKEIKPRQRSHTASTPKPSSKTPVCPASATRSAKAWKRRPKAAHSGVPVPEKMKRLQFELQECSF